MTDSGPAATVASLRVAFAGTFAASLEGRVRAHLGVPCDIVVSDEARLVSCLADVDVLVTMAFTRAAGRLRLVQVPGGRPGPDRPRGAAGRGGAGQRVRYSARAGRNWPAPGRRRPAA